TRRPSGDCSASYTTPMPPRPTSRTIRKPPTSVNGARTSEDAPPDPVRGDPPGTGEPWGQSLRQSASDLGTVAWREGCPAPTAPCDPPRTSRRKLSIEDAPPASPLADGSTADPPDPESVSCGDMEHRG